MCMFLIPMQLVRKSVEVNTYYAMNLSQAYMGAVMPIWSTLWKL